MLVEVARAISRAFKDPVLPNVHCALRVSAAIFLMLKNPVGLVAL